MYSQAFRPLIYRNLLVAYIRPLSSSGNSSHFCRHKHDSIVIKPDQNGISACICNDNMPQICRVLLLEHGIESIAWRISILIECEQSHSTGGSHCCRWTIVSSLTPVRHTVSNWFRFVTPFRHMCRNGYTVCRNGYEVWQNGLSIELFLINSMKNMKLGCKTIGVLGYVAQLKTLYRSCKGTIHTSRGSLLSFLLMDLIAPF